MTLPFRAVKPPIDVLPQPPELLDEETLLISLDKLYPELAAEAKSSVAMVASVREFANTDPEAFLTDLMTKGRTPDTEIMLQGFGFKPEDIDEVFPEEPPEVVPLELPQAKSTFTRNLEGFWGKELVGVVAESIGKPYAAVRNPDVEDYIVAHPEIWEEVTARQQEFPPVGLFEGLKVLGGSLIRLPRQLAASILQASQGFGGASVVDKDWADRFIESANTDLETFARELAKKYQGRPSVLGIPVEDLASVSRNLAFSLTSMGAGLGVGVPIAFAPVPGARVAAWTAGTAASGAVAYNITTYQITQQYLEIKNDEMIAERGRGLTQAEETKLKDEFASLARRYGLWEAIPEAISNLAFVGILTAPLTKMVGGTIAAQITSKVALMYGQELLTETITQKGQSQVEIEAGLREGKITWIEAFKEIAPQTFLLTTIMAGAGQVVISSSNALRKTEDSLKTEIGEDHSLFTEFIENIRTQFAEAIVSERGGIGGLPARPGVLTVAIWNGMTTVQRVASAERAGLETTVGEKAFEALTEAEKAAMAKVIPETVPDVVAPTELEARLQVELVKAGFVAPVPEAVPEVDFITISTKLAQDQRVAPERAMNRIQHSQIAQLYGFAAEHVGDITNRMAEDVVAFKGNFGAVEEKVRKTLRVLRDRFGFEREFMEQIEANFPFIKKTLPTETAESALVRLKELGQSYADEHKKLVVANEAQRVARDAAVAIGEFRFQDAIRNLEILEAEIKTGREAWDRFALEGLVAPTPPAVEPIVHKGTEPEGISIAGEIGVRYEGIQEGIVPTTMMFTDVQQTGSTFTATTLEEAQTKLAAMREAFVRAETVAEVTFEQGIAELTDEQAVELMEAGLDVTQPFPTERQVVSGDGEIIPPDQPIAKGVSDNTLIVKDIGAKERVRSTRHVYGKMGLYQTWKGIQRAEVEIGEARTAFDKKLKEVNKWVKKNRRALVFRELENPETITGLTFNEKRAVAWFRQFFDTWADTLKLPPEKRLTNYVTHIFEAELARQLQETGAIDPAMSRAMEYRAPKTIFNPFLQERLGKTGVLEDPFAAASAYEARELRVFYYEPHLQKIAAIANDLNTPEIARRYLLDYSRRMTNKPANIDKEINDTLRELGAKLSKLPGGSILANYLNRGNPMGMASYNFTSALYVLWLGFKPTSAIRNLSQHTLIIGEVGPVRFSEAIAKTFTAESERAVRESLVMRSRKAAFMPGIDDSFASKWVDKFRETALFMFRQADKLNVRHAFLAGYYEAKHLLPNADRQVWLDRGDEVAADTQYLYTKMNSMAIAQSALGRVFSVLTTWTSNWMELMTKWVSRRPSQVYTEYEAATGEKVSGANWATSYKAILMYMAIVGLGYLIKDQTRLKAWEYTGITSLRYLSDIVGGEFPGLEIPGAVADVIVGFLTNDDQMLSSGWKKLGRDLTPNVARQIDQVASGERDWMTLFFYLKGQDYKINKLKGQWEKEWKDYPTGDTDKVRKQWRIENPALEAKMFVTNRFTVLSSDMAREEVLRLIEKHELDTDLINGYEKIFGIDSSVELQKIQRRLGTEKPFEEGEEVDYIDLGDFATEVNKFVRNQGRDKVIRDGSELAIEYLEAQDSFVQYDAITTNAGRLLFREQYPDIEAQLYLWGRVTVFQNPESAKILLDLMEKYDIPPQGIRAFKENPEKYDELLREISEEPTPEPTTPEGIRAFEGLLR